MSLAQRLYEKPDSPRRVEWSVQLVLQATIPSVVLSLDLPLSTARPNPASIPSLLKKLVSLTRLPVRQVLSETNVPEDVFELRVASVVKRHSLRGGGRHTKSNLRAKPMLELPNDARD